MSYTVEGLTYEQASAIEESVVRAFGCRDADGRRTRSIRDRAQELVASDSLALRNAARAVLSERRRPWEALVIAEKILRRYAGATS